jgi:hypothetical protein
MGAIHGQQADGSFLNIYLGAVLHVKEVPSLQSSIGSMYSDRSAPFQRLMDPSNGSSMRF